MLNHRTPTHNQDRTALPLARQSRRPALTRLVLLAAADPTIAERLLRDDPFDTTVAHPHYIVHLDASDRATLAAIRARARTTGEFLTTLADVADNVALEWG